MPAAHVAPRTAAAMLVAAEKVMMSVHIENPLLKWGAIDISKPFS